jgi:Ca2+-binding EF-hand superfamily protein
MDGMLTRYDIVLTNLGEKMSDDEVDELLKAVDTSSGEINYTGTLTARNTLIDRLELTV